MVNDRIRHGFVIIGVLILSSCGKSQVETPRGETRQSVVVTRVVLGSMSGSRAANGRLAPREEMIISADLPGYLVTNLLADEGDFVRKGQVLAKLDTSLVESGIAQARASLVQQRLSAQQAAQKARRVRDLEGQGVLSDEEIEDRRISARIATASASATEAQLRDLLVRQSHLVIRAPADGIVLERSANVGHATTPGGPLFRLARDGLLELHAELPEKAVVGVQPGDPVEVGVEGGRHLQGTVRLIGVRVAPRTGLVTVRISLPPDRLLRTDGFASARFLATGAPVATVPAAAVQYDTVGAFVRTVDASSHIRRVGVTTGRRTAQAVELLTGPPVGSLVVMRGGAFTLEGDKVDIAKPGETGQ